MKKYDRQMGCALTASSFKRFDMTRWVTRETQIILEILQPEKIDKGAHVVLEEERSRHN